jgi:ADP-heptose:LPS heptosyltransferase
VVDYKNLNNLYLNRSDRIGDAIISKPFIKLLIEWLRNNECSAEVVIIASKYNRFLLQDLENPDNHVRVIEEAKQIDDYESKLSSMIAKHVHFLYKTLLFRWTHGSERDEQSIFFDMGWGDLVTILRYKELYNPIIAGPNIFWGSHILDIALSHSYVHYSNQNLIESYIEIVTKAFGIDNSFRNFVYDHIGTFYEYDETIPKTGICLFIGVKEFRNLPIATWRRVIHEVSSAFPEEKITVLDDNTNLLYNIFSQEKFPSNVTLEKNTFSLTDFTKHIALFAFVVGIDGGGINMVKSLINSCFINTFAQPNVWSWFTGDCPRQVTKWQNNWFSTISEIPPHGQVISHMHKTSFWLPTFNIDGNRQLFANFDTPLLIQIIHRSLKK